MDFIEILVFPWVFLTCHMKNTQKNSCCVIVKDVHLKFSRIFVVKSCLEKTRLLITVAGCKKYRFFLKKFEVNKQNCRDEMSNFSYLSLFDQSHPGCFSRYVESFIRGVMGFVVRFLACGSHFFPLPFDLPHRKFREGRQRRFIYGEIGPRNPSPPYGTFNTARSK